MNFKTFFLVGLVLSVSACGGGGDNSSSGSGSSGAPAPSVALTTSNSDQVASTAGSGDSVTSSATNLVSLNAGQSTTNTLSLNKFATRILNLASSNSLQPLATCSSGSVTTQNSSTTSGTVTFNKCVGFVAGTTIDGSVTFSLTGDVNADFTATMSFNSLVITSGGNTVTIDVSITIVNTLAGNVQTTKVSYDLFKVKYNTDYVNIYNYQSTVTYDNSSLDYTITWDYTFDSSLINGAVKVTTETPIAGNDNNPYPYTGSMIFTGANNSHVRVSTNNSTGQPDALVQIEVDADGDGVYESIKTMPWSQFDSLTQVVLY
jgi:hypothetical protein